MTAHLEQHAFFWTLQSLCTVFARPYDSGLARQQCAAPYTPASLAQACRALGFDVRPRRVAARALRREAAFPVLALCGEKATGTCMPLLVFQADGERLVVAGPADVAPRTVDLEAFAAAYTGQAIRVAPAPEVPADADDAAQALGRRRFGFAWFVPELRRHRRMWQEIVLASLVIQLIALASPLFTQAIIDKVVVHRTGSTLVVVLLGMAIFILFGAALTWLRQYLVLHTGNRVDAVLGAAVFERLFKLPPHYFQHRPTGVISARLQCAETIREFIAGAAVTVLLDLPFLLVFAAIMLYYSVPLTLLVLAVLGAIAAASMLVAPVFQRRLQEQFQLGARNQAFVTEYVAGLETVKSLQLEPQLNARYGGYLASYLTAGFSARQLANTYNTFAGLAEQLMGLLVLGVGAWAVMHDAGFTIGMLVAFQMFAGRLAQPMLRLAGLWQQFQQARLAVARLGDVMNAPVEPYTMRPSRARGQGGAIRVENLAFRYGDHGAPLYENLSLAVAPGQTVAIIGPSGCGKSTLARLLLGFYQPNAGRIVVDGVDIAHLSANELRAHFGVVPQETVLFSGTIWDNLRMASPDATFEQVVAACRMAEVHDVIEALPDGYHSEIGERGAGLSGGQKQRIAIARALLKRPGILVFDEATSALDGPTAELFAHTINALRGKVTMLFITHGLPRGLKVDSVFRLGPHGAQSLAEAPAPAAARAERP